MDDAIDLRAQPVDDRLRGTGRHQHAEPGLQLVEPGDAIIVPPRFKGPNPLLQMLPGMTQSLSQAAFQGAIQGIIP